MIVCYELRAACCLRLFFLIAEPEGEHPLFNDYWNALEKVGIRDTVPEVDLKSVRSAFHASQGDGH
jgi:hypothetical protein